MQHTLKQVSLFFLATLTCLYSLTVFAHGDDDHSSAPPEMNQVVSPRALANSEEFELVAILNGKKLQIYIDQYATNAPILGAQVEVEGVGLKAIAKETSPGVYTVDLPAKLAEKYALTFTIFTDDANDLLSAVLDSTVEKEAHTDDHFWDSKFNLALLAAFLAALALGAYFFLTRKTKQASLGI